MADASTIRESEETPVDPYVNPGLDQDPAETAEWLESLDYVLSSKGSERVKFLLTELERRATIRGVDVPMPLNTPYINTIPPERQPAYPGNRELERRIKSIIRWN